MTRPWALLAACTAAALLASACTSDKPKPNYSSVTPTPSPTTSASKSPGSDSPDIPSSGPNSSPGESAPTQPSSALTGTAEAAQSFESYYIKLIDWMYATSAPRILEPLYDASCQNCRNFVSNLTTQVANGSTFRGSRISIQRLALVNNDGRAGADFAVSVEISATALKILDSAGKVTDQGPASTLTLTNWLHWTGTSWVIVDQGKA